MMVSHCSVVLISNSVVDALKIVSKFWDRTWRRRYKIAIKCSFVGWVHFAFTV